MHNAPSVTYPVGRSRFIACLAASLWLAGAAAIALWLFQSDSQGWRQGSAVLALVAAGAWAAASWWRSAAGDLAWDGSAWSWRDAPATGDLRVVLDLQHYLLVHWQAEQARCWLCLERRMLPRRWLDLRRAVYSRARPHALAGARPPAAKP